MDFLIPFTKNLDPQQQQYVTPVKFEGTEEAEGTSTIYGIETNEEDPEMQNENEEANMEDQEEPEMVYETFEIADLPTQPQQPQIHHHQSHMTSPTKHNITISAPQILNSHSTPQVSMPIINSNLPIACSSTDEQQSSADLSFFKSLLPDVKQMSLMQKRRLRMGVLKLIDDVLAGTE